MFSTLSSHNLVRGNFIAVLAQQYLNKTFKVRLGLHQTQGFPQVDLMFDRGFVLAQFSEDHLEDLLRLYAIVYPILNLINDFFSFLSFFVKEFSNLFIVRQSFLGSRRLYFDGTSGSRPLKNLFYS